MRQVAGPTIVGANQITPLVLPADNVKGLILLSFYTQVIQGSTPGNVAQSLVLASNSAPVDFASKLKCFPLYRTFQSDKQSLVALGGFAPMNVINVQIPQGWGIWQVLSVTGDALSRNNMRLGLTFL